MKPVQILNTCFRGLELQKLLQEQTDLTVSVGSTSNNNSKYFIRLCSQRKVDVTLAKEIFNALIRLREKNLSEVNTLDFNICLRPILKAPKFVTVIVCKGYDDYLSYTIDRTIEESEYITVITSKTDANTHKLLAKKQVNIFDSKYLDNSFCKGKAIAEYLETLDRNIWVILLDADILLPKGWRTNLQNYSLDKDKLYYTVRKGPLVEDLHVIQNAVNVALRAPDWRELWDTLGNRIFEQGAPWGYCQIFNLSSAALSITKTRYPAESDSAEKDDHSLAYVWYGVENQILLNSNFEVLHLPHGPRGTNWHGRVSTRLDNDTWWINSSDLKWRISFRAGEQFTGLWRFAHYIKLPEQSVIIEIGTMLGDSASLFAAIFPETKVITVDPGPSPLVQQEAKTRLSYWKNVEKWEMYSSDAAKKAKELGLKIGLVYIDGDHGERAVREDITVWKDLICDGGYLAGHDYTFPEVKKAVLAELGEPSKVFEDSTWLGKHYGH